MSPLLVRSGLGLLTAMAIIGSVSANEFEQPIKNFAASDIKPWLSSAEVVDAVKAQNMANAALSAADIEKLDKEWRAETAASDQPLINKVSSNTLSAFLREKKSESGGLITEMFVMDNKGLNVGLSDVTSDYWQGDEAKWQKTFLAGPDAMHISDVEQDESTQTFQSQVSMPVVDPADNSVIGAVTVGMNVELLAQ